MGENSRCTTDPTMRWCMDGRTITVWGDVMRQDRFTLRRARSGFSSRVSRRRPALGPALYSLALPSVEIGHEPASATFRLATPEERARDED